MPRKYTGWYKRHRKICDNPLFVGAKAKTKRDIWAWLLDNATWATDPDKPINAIKRPLHPGEIFTSMREIAKHSGISHIQVMNVLKVFEKEKMILIHTAKVQWKQLPLPLPPRLPQQLTVGTLVTIRNWKDYQGSANSELPPDLPLPLPLPLPVIRSKEAKEKKDCYYDPRRSPSQYDYTTKDEKLSVYMAYDNITNADVDGGVRNTQVRMLLHEVGLEKTKLLLELLTGELKLKNLKRLSLRETKELHQVGLYLLDKKTHLPDKR